VVGVPPVVRTVAEALGLAETPWVSATGRATTAFVSLTVGCVTFVASGVGCAAREAEALASIDAPGALRAGLGVATTPAATGRGGAGAAATGAGSAGMAARGCPEARCADASFAVSGNAADAASAVDALTGVIVVLAAAVAAAAGFEASPVAAPSALSAAAARLGADRVGGGVVVAVVWSDGSASRAIALESGKAAARDAALVVRAALAPSAGRTKVSAGAVAVALTGLPAARVGVEIAVVLAKLRLAPTVLSTVVAAVVALIGVALA
jgi:hypothetical protein